MIRLFVRPQTQRERNVVRFSAAVCRGGALRDDTKNGCVADYDNYGLSSGYEHIPISDFIRVINFWLYSSSNTLLVIYFALFLLLQYNWPLQKIPEHTIMLFFVTPKFCLRIVFTFSWELKWPQEKLKTMLRQNFGVTNKEHYGKLWYFLEWSIMSYYVLENFKQKNFKVLLTWLLSRWDFFPLGLFDKCVIK